MISPAQPGIRHSYPLEARRWATSCAPGSMLQLWREGVCFRSRTGVDDLLWCWSRERDSAGEEGIEIGGQNKEGGNPFLGGMRALGIDPSTWTAPDVEAGCPKANLCST